MRMLDMGAMVAALRVLSSGELARYHTTRTSEVQRLESELCRTIGVRYALGVNSGTSALICALVGAGIGPGDEVLVPAYTWVSSAAAPLAVGAIPVLVEIDETLTIDPVDVERKITPNTRAIIPVHMMNLVCNMDAILAIAARHNLVVIEDACQAVGLTYRGKRVGSLGHAGAFSFNQHKNIKAGEGGAVLTNDPRVYARAAMYHDVGSYTRENRMTTDEPLFVGVNYRMPELSAAILRPQLHRLDKKLERLRRRRQLAIEKLRESPFSDFEVAPHNDPESAVGLAVTFEDPERARAFGSVRGISRLIDTGRHVYSNWQSVLAKRTAHPKLNPYSWAQREVELSAECCPRTLEILSRTCSVSLLPEVPTFVYRALLYRMANHRR